jgi:ubiquinone/menaquinone biosynthesis C-methylase UbiE
MSRERIDRDQPATIANVEQAAAWDGDDGNDWTEHEEHYNATIRPHTARLFARAQIAADGQVLDIGCGCGETTRRAAQIAMNGGGLGVDLSNQMLARARERSASAGLTNVSYERADARVHPFEAEAFDVAISRFGVMFFGDPVAAFRNVHRALKPGGTVAFLAWQSMAQNEWLATMFAALAAGRDLPGSPTSAPGPFGLADPDAVRRIFDEAGFQNVTLEAVSEPVTVGTAADDAFTFIQSLGVARGMLRDVDDATRNRAMYAVRAAIDAHATDRGVQFGSGA